MNTILENADFDSNENLVAKELKRLRDNEIPYDYALCGSKYRAIIKLTNGKKLLVCPYRKKALYRNKEYKYKFLPNWLKKQGLEVQL